MRKCERYKAEFLRPKKSNWFGRKEYKAVTKGKILGFTAANGAQLFVRCPSPWNSGAFAKLVRKRVGPFFQRAFPHRRSFRILLDSEPLLHTDEATAALSEFGITAMSGWPKYSPGSRRRCARTNRSPTPTLSSAAGSCALRSDTLPRPGSLAP